MALVNPATYSVKTTADSVWIAGMVPTPVQRGTTNTYDAVADAATNTQIEITTSEPVYLVSGKSFLPVFAIPKATGVPAVSNEIT